MSLRAAFLLRQYRKNARERPGCHSVRENFNFLHFATLFRLHFSRRAGKMLRVVPREGAFFRMERWGNTEALDDGQAQRRETDDRQMVAACASGFRPVRIVRV